MNQPFVRTLLQRGMVREAKACLNESTDTSSFELRQLRATTHLLIEEWSEAEKIYRDLVMMKPDSPSLLSEFAFCLRQLDRSDEALTPAQRAVHLAPDQASFRVELVEILIELNRLREARQELIAVEKIDATETRIDRLRKAIENTSTN